MSDGADILSQWLDCHNPVDQLTVPYQDRGSPIQASHAQRGMWLAHETAGAQESPLTAFHVYELTGRLDVAALTAALDAVVVRHEALRTNFTLLAGDLYQIVRPPFSPGPGNAQETDPGEVPGRLEEIARLPFDLENGRLFRAHLLRTGPDRHVLALAFHHIVNDGWSMDILHRELSALYTAALASPAVADPTLLCDAAGLPELTLHYPDYAAWQRLLADERSDYAAALAHWRRHLSGAPTNPVLPGDRPRPAVRSCVGDTAVFPFPAGTSAAVESRAHALGTTPFTVQFAAFRLLVGAWSGCRDLVMGVATAHRALVEAEPLIGFFVNILPLRTAPEPQDTFASYTARTGSDLIAGYEHGDVPFELLLEELGVERSAAHNPLVQVTVASHQGLSTPIDLPDLDAVYRPVDRVDVQEDLTLYLKSGPEGLYGHVAFRTDVFDRKTVKQLASAYLELLDRACTEPEVPLDDLVAGIDLPAPVTTEPAHEVAAARGSDEGSRSAAEELVAAVWEEVLGEATPTYDANFFATGGTSLLAARLARTLTEETGVQVPVRAVFDNSTLSRLAAHVEELIREAMRAEAEAE